MLINVGYAKKVKPAGCNKRSYSFVDANGVAYYLYDNTEFPVLIDVNGDRKPNQLGRDRFVMFFGNSFEPHNTYPDTVNAVLLYEDIKGKQIGRASCRERV